MPYAIIQSTDNVTRSKPYVIIQSTDTLPELCHMPSSKVLICHQSYVICHHPNNFMLPEPCHMPSSRAMPYDIIGSTDMLSQLYHMPSSIVLICYQSYAICHHPKYCYVTRAMPYTIIQSTNMLPELCHMSSSKVLICYQSYAICHHPKY